MDDGSYEVSGVSFHTEGFNLKDVYKLASMLHYVFNLECTVQIKDKKNNISNNRNDYYTYLL
jgi:hypothetical protein